jgi:hypothetical protein
MKPERRPGDPSQTFVNARAMVTAGLAKEVGGEPVAAAGCRRTANGVAEARRETIPRQIGEQAERRHAFLTSCGTPLRDMPRQHDKRFGEHHASDHGAR